MSKALPIVVAALLGGVALVPVYYAAQNPAKFISAKHTPASFDVNNSTAIQKMSYAFGYEVTSQMTPPELDVNAFSAGARDGHNKVEFALSEEQLQAAYQEFVSQQKPQQPEVAPQLEQPAASANTANTANADNEFLVENAKKAGVKTTESGLQYTVEKEGTGKQPKATDIVEVHYEGKLINGQVFDSSFSRGTPIEFPLNQVIPGWTEGLQLMKEGSEYTFYIPSELGYGANGSGPIPPNSTLIFKVQLISVK